jgi:sRNA-binding regulator protein Hfq
MFNIETGSQVKYFLLNGMVLEGIVEKDTASECVLRSLDGKSLMIIHRPSEDILMTKVVLGEEVEVPEEKETPKE